MTGDKISTRPTPARTRHRSTWPSVRGSRVSGSARARARAPPPLRRDACPRPPDRGASSASPRPTPTDYPGAYADCHPYSAVSNKYHAPPMHVLNCHAYPAAPFPHAVLPLTPRISTPTVPPTPTVSPCSSRSRVPQRGTTWSGTHTANRSGTSSCVAFFKANPSLRTTLRTRTSG